MQITKGKLVQLIASLDNDPQLLSKIIVECFKKLPDAYAWQLSQQLYIDYFYDGEVFEAYNKITGTTRRFAGASDLSRYLRGLGYDKASNAFVRKHAKDGKPYHNHIIKIVREGEVNEEEITYL